MRRYFLKVALTILILVILLSYVDINKFRTSLFNINSRYFFIACLFTPLFLLLKALKWFLLVKSSKRRIKLSDAIKSFLSGITIGLLTPARIGELARAFYFNSTNFSFSLVGLVVIDKIIDLIVLIILACFSLMILADIKIVFLAAILGISLIILLFRKDILMNMLNTKLVKYLPFKKAFFELKNGLNQVKARDLIINFLLTSLIFLIVLIQCYFLVLAFEPVSFRIIYLTFPVIILTNVLPITIGGLGVRESAAALIFYQLGISKITGINSSFLLFIINTLSLALLGLLFIPEIKKGEFYEES